MKLCLEASIGVEQMQIIKHTWICDRCHEEHDEKELYHVADWMYHYQLCEKCKLEFKEYEAKVKAVEEHIDELSKGYKFGKYLPRREKQEGEEIY